MGTTRHNSSLSLPSCTSSSRKEQDKMSRRHLKFWLSLGGRCNLYSSSLTTRLSPRRRRARRSFLIARKSSRPSAILQLQKPRRRTSCSTASLLARRECNGTKLCTRCNPRIRRSARTTSQTKAFTCVPGCPSRTASSSTSSLSSLLMPPRSSVLHAVDNQKTPVTIRQYTAFMGILNDYLAYLPTVYNYSMAVEGQRNAMCHSMRQI